MKTNEVGGCAFHPFHAHFGDGTEFVPSDLRSSIRSIRSTDISFTSHNVQEKSVMEIDGTVERLERIQRLVQTERARLVRDMAGRTKRVRSAPTYIAKAICLETVCGWESLCITDDLADVAELRQQLCRHSRECQHVVDLKFETTEYARYYPPGMEPTR